VEKEQIGSQTTRVSAGLLNPLSEAEAPGPMLQLGLASYRLFAPLAQELKEETGIDIEYSAGGTLYVTLEEGSLEQIERRFQWQKEQGFRVDWLSVDQARSLEPALSDEIKGGFYSQEEGQVNPLKLAQAFAQAAVNRGATIRQGTKVTGIECSGSRVTGLRIMDESLSGGHYVLATGAWSGIWEEWLGRLTLPVFPVKGQLLALEVLPLKVRRVIYTGRTGYLVPRAYGPLLVGATQERVGFDLRLTASALGDLLNFATRMVPGLTTANFLGAWMSFRPGTPDEHPILGPAPEWQGVNLASGHFRKGILLAPITGQLIAELLLADKTSLPLMPFSPARFKAGRSS
jgi:glycine oxidase